MSKVLKILKPILATVAPTLATALGGPLAGVATSEISKILLGHPDGSDNELVDFWLANKNPETLAKMKQVEANFKVQMKDLDIEVERLDVQREHIAVDDRKSARARQAATKDRATAIIAGSVLLVFAVMIWALFERAIPTESAPVLFMLTGALATGVTQVLNFYFGSSKGSKSKDDLIAEVMAMSSAYAKVSTGTSVSAVKGMDNG